MVQSGSSVDRTPLGIDLAVGTAAVTAGLFVAAALPRVQLVRQDAVVCAVVGLFALFSLDWPAVAALVPITWLLMNGFVVNRLGTLSWHGRADVDRFVALALAGLLGLGAGVARRELLDLRSRWHLGAAVTQMGTTLSKETKRRA